MQLLLARGARELSENAPSDALDSFDAALDLSPDLLEGWRGRALARRALGDYAGAVRDIQELLKREPRSFLAFQDLSRVAEARKDWHGALVAWQKVLELDPHTPGRPDPPARSQAAGAWARSYRRPRGFELSESLVPPGWKVRPGKNFNTFVGPFYEWRAATRCAPAS